MRCFWLRIPHRTGCEDVRPVGWRQKSLILEDRQQGTDCGGGYRDGHEARRGKQSQRLACEGQRWSNNQRHDPAAQGQPGRGAAHEAGFISSPAIRNRMASPRSESTASRSPGSTSCSPCGPMVMPNRTPRNTAGRTATRRTAGTHAASAMAKNTVMAPTAMSAASILFPLSTCLGPTLPRRRGHRNPHCSGASRRYLEAVHHPAWGATQLPDVDPSAIFPTEFF